MESISLLLLLSIFIWPLSHLLASILRPRRSPNLPPGPPPLPIIGNLLHLGQNPHQSLTRLSKTYGPIIHLKLGTIHTTVVSSPELAKQVLQTHDYVLSGRLNPATSTACDHHKVSVVFLPANARWRALRKLCKDHLFSLQKMESSQGLRRRKLNELLHYVQECCDVSRVVDIADAAFVTSLNLITASLFSTDFAEFHSNSSQGFTELVHGVTSTSGKPNLADFFPVLKPFDPQGLKREMESKVGKLLKIFEDIIDERLKSSSLDSNDMLEALLKINRMNESELSKNDILHLLVDLFVAGIDTTTTTVEWIMAELIHNPKVMAKARNELHTVIGTNQQIDESDISKLSYLQAVVKETFRLHPTAPLLLPHRAETDTEISGFVIPKNTQVIVNTWGPSRDPNIWSNPDCFSPERFLDSKVDVKGQDFELIPFGSGRRICPGLPLAYRMVHLMVAYLIQGFDWKLEGGMKPEEMNMDEKYELTLQRAVPLKAIPIRYKLT